MRRAVAILTIFTSHALALLMPAQSNPESGVPPGDPGPALFTAHCASCHQSDGGGTKGGPPPLEGSAWVTGSETRLIKIVLQGMRGKIEVGGTIYNLEMPGFAKVMTDGEIAAVLSFVRRKWGEPGKSISGENVRRIRDATRNRTEYWTAEELLRDP